MGAKQTDEGLSHAGFKILSVLRRRLRPGVRHRVSQAEIAQWAGVSEATVNTVLRKQLDGLYLHRHLVLVGAKQHAEIELFPSDAAPRTTPVAAPTKRPVAPDFPKKLRELQIARDEELITQAEYDELRARILADF